MKPKCFRPGRNGDSATDPLAFDEVLIGEDEIVIEELVYRETSLSCLSLFAAIVGTIFEDLACNGGTKLLSDCQRLKDKAWQYLNSEAFEEYCDSANMDVEIFRTKGRQIYENNSQVGTRNHRLAAA